MIIFLRTLLFILVSLMLLWGGTSIVTQIIGNAETSYVTTKNNSPKKVLFVYKADPFYNLDQQICQSLAEGLSELGYSSSIVTTKNFEPSLAKANLYVFCTNTYNFAPDWDTKKFIQNKINLKGKKTVAITLGAGTTARAKRLLEKSIQQAGGEIIASKEFWLMRPNDESRMDEDNVTVANEIAKNWATDIVQKINAF